MSEHRLVINLLLVLCVFVLALRFVGAAMPAKLPCTRPSRTALVVESCSHGRIKVVRAVIGSELHILTFVKQSGVWFLFSDTLAKNLPNGGPAS